jgi:hypothetical protein
MTTKEFLEECERNEKVFYLTKECFIAFAKDEGRFIELLGTDKTFLIVFLLFWVILAEVIYICWIKNETSERRFVLLPYLSSSILSL